MSYLSRQRTRGGYAGDEVMSALQKEIRRGNERDAYFWAQELASIKPNGKAMLWNRLVTICHEDIGIANPLAAVYLETCRQQWERIKGEGNGTGHFILFNAIALMCRGNKTRMANNAVFWMEFGGYRAEMPDYALDKHTARGRRTGRGMEHWLDEGAKIESPEPFPDPYEELARPVFLQKEHHSYYAEQGEASDRKESTAQLPLLASEPGEVVSEPAFDDHQGGTEDER